MAILHVQGLRLGYRTSHGVNYAVDGVDLALPEGESIGVVGESGCGKTTLTRGIMRVLPRNARILGGSVAFHGRDLLKLSEREMRQIRWRQIAMVPQSAMDSLDPVYRVVDQFVEVLVGRGGLRRGAAIERAEELFRMVGLDVARLRHHPHQFSGGMKQRVAIALALALGPQVIIADEPVTALDVIVQHQVLKLLKRLQGESGTTLVMITHDISVVAALSDKVAVMYAGQVVEYGGAVGVLKAAWHPYTMGLTNSFPSLLAPERRLASISGHPPSLIDPPQGCRFADRCPFALEICRREAPPVTQVDDDGHLVACHRHEEAVQLREQAREANLWASRA